MNQTDLFIIGGGPAGYVGALRAARAGLSVVLAERDRLGGACLHWGCIPSKSLMASADLLEKIKQAASFGIAGIDGKAATADWPAMNERAGKIVGRLEKGVTGLLDQAGVQRITGQARVIARDRVDVNGEEYQCKNLLIATGADYPLPAWAADDPRFFTPQTIYGLKELPATMAIIGAGVVGVEFSVLFARLGVKVTLLENKESLMSYLDKDMATQLTTMLKRRRIKVLSKTKAVAMNTEGLQVESTTEVNSVPAEVILWCPRRKARLAGLEALVEQGLTIAGGYINTDERARTSLPGVYAAGDVNGRLMLAHVASKEALTAVETILGTGRDLVYDMMPYNMYTAPEFASIGLTEQQAEERGFLVGTGTFPLAANGKAMAEGNSDGFVKLVFERKYNEVLGVHIVASHATDLIGEATLAMGMEATLEALEAVVHPHPTMAEVMVEAAWKGMDRPIHTT